MSSTKKLLYKVIIVGDSGVGKTSLINQFVNKKYTKAHNVTVAIDFLSRDIVVRDRIVTVQIWDTAGQERFWALSSAFYRAVDCCVIVFDVSSRSSFSSLERWYVSFLNQAAPIDTTKFPFVVLGNKLDLQTRSVCTTTAKQWCLDKNDIPYYEISAKHGIGVEAVFQDIAQKASEMKPESDDHTSPEHFFLRPDEEKKSVNHNCC